MAERNGQHVKLSEKALPVTGETEVLVVGGGLAGVTSALAAAREGAAVTLVERLGAAGGIATSGLLGALGGFHKVRRFKPEQIVRGFADQLLKKLEAEQGLGDLIINKKGTHTLIPYDTQILQKVFDEFLREYKINVLFNQMPIEVVTREGAIHSVIFYGKGGWQVINCQVAVDATGDGDLSDLAGAAELKDGAYHQYSSTVFHLSGVDTSAAEQTDREQLGKIMKEAVRKGDFELPRLDGGITRLPKNGEMRCNLTRVSYEDRPMNPTNALELSYAEAEGRRQAYLYLAFLKQWVPGYKHAYISRLPAHVGVRETRRFKGEYVLTKEDILAAKKFEDGIASYSWPVEVHKKGRETIWEAVPEGEHYEIPLRSLIAESLDNLFIPGRCFSATQEAHASARTAAGCLAMGEAAGVTAGTASARDKRVKEIPYDEIVNKLKAYGACLE